MTGMIEHKRKIKEHLEELAEAIDIGIEKRPATIGFHCSACAAELLELYLHKLGAISSGKIIKHEWFKRPTKEQKILPLIERKLPVTFQDKEAIYDLFYDIEEHRNELIYGKATKAQIEAVLNAFNKLKAMLTKKLQELGEELE